MRLTKRFIFEFLKKKPDKVSPAKVEQIIQAVEKPQEPPSKVDQLKYQFTPFQLYITQGKGIQRPYSGEHYWRSHGTVGNYHCVVCGSHLFTNFHKFSADTGICGFWGSEQDAVQVQPDHEVNWYSIDKELHPPTWIHYSVKDGAINFTPKPDFELPPPRNWAKKEKREVKKKQKEEKEKLQQEQQREESRQKKLAKKQEKELQEKKEEQKQQQQDQNIHNKAQFQ